MALIVEDGSGKSNADAYVTEAYVDTYNTAFVNDSTWVAGATDAKERAIRHATAYLDGQYTWRGDKKTAVQKLDWPRNGVVDANGFAVSSSVVPVAVQEAAAELAIKDLTTLVLPDVAATAGAVVEDHVEVGPITVRKKFSEGTTSESTEFVHVDNLLKDLILSGPNSAVGLVERG